jgi:hypothetical protein
MTDAKVFHRDSKGRGFELPHQGVFSVGERGLSSQIYEYRALC